ncbi:MAG: SusC/RagA family TonB-linked outer membrane protein [Sphingobacteriales bacterium]
MKRSVPFLLLFLFPLLMQSQDLFKGRVADARSRDPLPGATVRVKGTSAFIIADKDGYFSLQVARLKDTLQVFYVGYKLLQVPVPQTQPFTIFLEPNTHDLDEVIVSTGYQTLPKERATGSFEHIGNALLNREVSTDVLSRLDGIASSVSFDKRPGSENVISVRGLSTLTATISQPLVVVDNFPYLGDVTNINPNDVESVTILKDAAASSIWGTRAGNGVIVITTKHGKYNQPMRISLNSNVTVSQKPDLYTFPAISSPDFINVEKYLFSQGFYDDDLANIYTFPVISPVVDILSQERNGTLSAADANQQISALGQHDLRRDLLKYAYRNAVSQQYDLNISGGNDKADYVVSAGYDHNLQTLVGNSYERFTFRDANEFRPLKNLSVQTSIQFTHSLSVQNSQASYGGMIPGGGKLALYPYAQLADANGNPLPAPKDYGRAFVDTAGNGNLLSWQYKPLQETQLANNPTRLDELLLNAGLHYQLTKAFSAEVKYQYEDQVSNNPDYYSEGTYLARSLINTYTQFDGTNYTPVIPLGGILDDGKSLLNGQDLRGQLNFDPVWKGGNRLNAIIGAEVSQQSTSSALERTYGFSDNSYTSQPVDMVNLYNTYDGLEGQAGVPYMNSFSSLLNRSVSLYGNLAYTYHDKYTLSLSARKDASNLFGVTTNRKWVPLWSAGGSWLLSNEKFYHWDAVPFLKLRTTYGYSGNVNNSIPAVTTIDYLTPNFANSINNLPFAVVDNFPNPNLRWEKIGQLNVGLDFASKGNRISGSIEYYYKNAMDLLGLVQADITAGAGTTLNYNSASLHNRGFDITLNSINTIGAVKWNTALLFSMSKNTVARYLFSPSGYSQYINSGSVIDPIVGQPAYSIISFKWAGLDPANGNPRAYLNGKVSEDYAAIVSSVSKQDLVFSGSALPQYFGSLRNDVSFRRFTLSANLVYRFDYYFRRNAISYSSLFNYWVGYGDFNQRWQKPGDERSTQVPSMDYPADPNRDAVYGESNVTVMRGDNIRLQDMRLSYRPDQSKLRWLPFRAIELYAYADNLGILWRANKLHLDPDYGSAIPAPKTLSLGCKLDF